MNKQSSTGASNSQFHPSPAESFISSFSTSTGDDSGYAGSPNYFNNSTIDPSSLSMGDDFSLFDNEPKSVHFAEDTKMEEASSQEKSEQPTKKEVKKRKSWGQQLPAPTTNLPPRKRAKTEAEKEQRRIERVLRNRRAAQSSRERKREEAEALQNEKSLIEERCTNLEKALRKERAQSDALRAQLRALGQSPAPGKPIEDLFLGTPEYQLAVEAREDARLDQESSPCPEEIVTPQQTAISHPAVVPDFEQLPASAMTQQYHNLPQTPQIYEYYIPQIEQEHKTIDPSHLSPVSDHSSPFMGSPAMKPLTNSDPTLPDMSQHSAEVYDGLPCQSAKEGLLKLRLSMASSAVATMWGALKRA